MMKQPAENPNATPQEEQQSKQRIIPRRDPEAERLEIEAELRRSSGANEPAEHSPEEWERAREIVRNRTTATSKA